MNLMEFIFNKICLTSLSYILICFMENYFFLFKLVNMFKDKINRKYVHMNLIERDHICFGELNSIGMNIA